MNELQHIRAVALGTVWAEGGAWIGGEWTGMERDSRGSNVGRGCGFHCRSEVSGHESVSMDCVANPGSVTYLSS